MPAPDCQTHFQKEFKAVFDGDQVIIVKANPGDKIYLNCQIDDYQMVVRNALVKNRSGINKLKGKPVTSCTNDIPCP